ncbi:MAG: NTP transferase domain-containing protein [Magnetococcales bacterium]|nr:NTP transferase domain-containing protein [Magnetococcales bacterium]MBF0321414.1 NTP transferase domain-containing protein [Magnetococcales bacterium]
MQPVTVAVLAGGLGTRVRGVLGQTPKLLAPLADRPFLEYLLEWLMFFGARRVVLCLGHRAGAIQEYLANHPGPPGLEMWPVIEPEPLGTAGALRHAMPHLRDRRVLLVNGDTFVGANLCRFHATHVAAKTEATLLCTQVPDVSRYGSVSIDADNRLQHFLEKDPSRQGTGSIYAGLILMEPAMLRRIAAHAGSSLEKDILHAMAPGSLAAMVDTYPFIDFGTPDSYAFAQTFFKNWAAHLSGSDR